eukprot:TRINITY_DN32513_c0_g2_i1.p1 TRINITY_DN32513_c0_g2~~TRINITY_DN32513_c0_g2_i1.p1  ORF type:complete len:285 (-),score=55.68 TRINITY_DN32513_c0_g2_i1:57-818(-)
MDEDWPAECDESKKWLKWSIKALIVTAPARLLFGFVQGLLSNDFVSLLQVFSCIAIGTFLFKDDSEFRSLYHCLSTTICNTCAERCRGVRHQLMALMFLSIPPAIMDLLVRAKLMSIMPFGVAFLGTIIAQAAMGLFSFRIFKQAQAEVDARDAENAMELATGRLGGLLGGGRLGRHGLGGGPAYRQQMDSQSNPGHQHSNSEGEGNRLGGGRSGGEGGGRGGDGGGCGGGRSSATCPSGNPVFSGQGHRLGS